MIASTDWKYLIAGTLCLMALVLAPGCGGVDDEGAAPDRPPHPSPEISSDAEAAEPSGSPNESASAGGSTAIGGDEASNDAGGAADSDAQAEAADDPSPPRPTGHGLQLPQRASVPAERLDDESWLGLLVTAVESAHGRTAWKDHEGSHFRARLLIERDDELPLEIALRQDLSGRVVRLDLPDGSVVLRRNNEIWRATGPMGGPPPEAREWIETLPRLLLAPVMLRRPGQRLAADGLQNVGDAQYLAATLTFTTDVDAAAHHWYAIFADPFRNRVAIMAYYFSSDHALDPAWQQQHAAVYEAYETVDGVTLPARWRLHKWSRARGVLGDPIGVVRVMSMGFEPYSEIVFNPPGNAELWKTVDPPTERGDESADAP